jgi:hypothetical protein
MQRKEGVRGTLHYLFELGTDAHLLLLVVFETFDLRQWVDHVYDDGPKPADREPETVAAWLDDKPGLGVDRNDIPIVLHLPNWYRKESLVSGLMPQKPRVLTAQKGIFNDICLRLSEAMPPTSGDGADKSWRNKESNYRTAEGEVAGRIKIATAWHAIGHPVSGLLWLMFCRKT